MLFLLVWMLCFLSVLICVACQGDTYMYKIHVIVRVRIEKMCPVLLLELNQPWFSWATQFNNPSNHMTLSRGCQNYKHFQCDPSLKL